ncbi:MAG: hypothetical protein HA488_00800 [Candidatus Verstraetearchaeota archaeon]|jgi:hypothetical protein|nr:hypothetical protein [Candidatus Culexarchaeum yellowstonense]MCR6669214.1 hypothetical protein [Candidatus Culexarchaeum yellowstonense]NHV11761.1 hypothetical protein [Candidatus Verstraetearchaeota archaeon]
MQGKLGSWDALLIILGSFTLSTWALFTLTSYRNFIIHLAYGLLTCISILMAYYALKYKLLVGKLLLAFIGGIYGAMVAFSYVLGDSSLFTSMVISGIGMLLLIYGFHGVE